MDARVTKHRLGNMLSYDWLKILCAIAAAVAGLVLFFTMVKIKPARAQKFYVHLYGDFEFGDKYNMLATDLESVLSYDVLDVATESFGSEMMAGASYTARRSAGEGSVVIAPDYAENEGDTSPFAELVQMGMAANNTPEESLNMFYEVDAYFAELEGYLARFFGEDWKAAPALNAEEVERCFRARNVDGPNNKNRFRSESAIASGIAEETARLEKLRADYIYLVDEAGLGGARLPYVTYTSEIRNGEGEAIDSKTYTVGIGLGGLANLDALISYRDKNGDLARDKLIFLIYDNGEASYDDGTNDGRADLKYEAVTFLKYLAEHYA